MKYVAVAAIIIVSAVLGVALAVFTFTADTEVSF